MKFLLESNPAFLLLEVGDNEYVFYNSLQHVGARLSELEVQILDLVYTYQDKEYILSKFSGNQYGLISDAITAIEEHSLLKCQEIEPTPETVNDFPTEYYIHLTYRCNLKCLYCYNKTVRNKLQRDLSVNEWKKIIDTILPYAKRIVFTGGECFLYEGIAELIDYIKQQKEDVLITAISNGMHNFEKLARKRIFTGLSELSLSCDSLYLEGKRIGFNPSLFRNNIEWIKNHFPHISLSLSSVYTCDNKAELKKIERYCFDNKLSFNQTILIPSSASEVELMPSIQEFYEDRVNRKHQSTARITHLKPPRFRCGAGRTVCSIAPNGDVYPCQSLHYPEFIMGNLLTGSIVNLNRELKLISVDDIPVCSRCNVKYICGGGCLATGYSFYKNRLNRNHLTCYMNKCYAIEKLKSLDNRLNQ